MLGELKQCACNACLSDGKLAAAASSSARRSRATSVSTRRAYNSGESREQTPVGHPMVNMRDIESGKVRATRELFGGRLRDAFDEAQFRRPSHQR